MKEPFIGLIAPPLTPFGADGEVKLDLVEAQHACLVNSGVVGAFVCGSTGEGPSLSTAERQAVAQRWREVAGERFQIIVHVGCLSVVEARALAAHAQQIGADAVAAVGPSYFRPGRVEELVEFCRQIAAGAPELPFYYYHIPALSGVYLPMAEFLPAASGRIPTLAGVKFTYENLMDFGRCAQMDGGRYRMLFGRDEILLAGLALGACGAIGTTYNFAAPLYARIVSAYQAGELEAAREDQCRAMELVAAMRQFGGVPAAKAMMKIIGLDCGPVRPPLGNLTDEQFAGLQRRLDKIGFFDYCAKA